MFQPFVQQQRGQLTVGAQASKCGPIQTPSAVKQEERMWFCQRQVVQLEPHVCFAAKRTAVQV